MNIKSEQGSILFYILIAVVLFAALSYAVSSMMRGGDQNVGSEKAGIYASEILGYAHAMRESVQMMQISNDCSDTGISFENNSVSGYDHSPVADVSCRLFDSNGGGLAYQTPSSDVNGGQDWMFTGSNDGYNVGTQCNSASCSDIIAILSNITLEICRNINKQQDIAVANDYVTQENDSFDVSKFQGSYSFAARISDDAGLQELKGKHQGCVEGNGAPQSSGTYYFYQILLAR